MDLNQIQQILQDNLSEDRTLTLPPDALESEPIKDVFRKYLLKADLVITDAYIVNVGPNITVVGEGGSFPFENTYVTAVFTAPSSVAAMAIEADGFDRQTEVWTFDKAFPVLGTTFVKDLQFTAAKLTLRSVNASLTQPPGLFFNGTQELTDTLAVISKLLNGSNEVNLLGPIELEGEQDASKIVPVMALEDPEPEPALNMQFIFQLIDEAEVVEKRPPTVNENGTKLVPVPAMQLVTRLTVDSEDGKKTLDVITHFTLSFNLLTFQANIGDALAVSQAAINVLAQGANLGSVLPAQLPLVDQFQMTQWSMSVVPQVPQITSISIEAGIVQPWDVIPGVFKLRGINFVFTINYVNEKYEPNASLTATIDILDGTPAKFSIVVDAQYPSYIITGFLEEGSKIDLNALILYFIKKPEVAANLPCKDLQVEVLTLLLDPRNSTYSFETVVSTNCSVNLGATFTLTQIHFNFNYVAGDVDGTFAAAFWIVPPQGIPLDQLSIDDPPPGAVAMEVSASYNSVDKGWSFRGGLAEGGKIDLQEIISLYLPPEYQAWIPDVVITQLEAGFETGESKSYDFTIGARWFIDIFKVTIGAVVKVTSVEEEGKRKDEGEIQGMLRFGGDPDAEEGGLQFKVTAKFNDTTQVYIFEFLGWTATLSSSAQKKTLTFAAGQKTLGEMIEVLINAVSPGSDIKLTSPWSVLNSVPLGNFTFTVEFDAIDSSPKSAGLSYSPNINLGFAKIGTFKLSYEVKTEKVWFEITSGQFLGNEIVEPVKWDVANPEDAPPVPGEGSELFKLSFLGLGQHMGVWNEETNSFEPPPASITGAIKQLTEAFTETEKKALVFNEATDWLIAADFTLLEAVRLGIVFYDPELYGLVIQVNGSKAAEKLPIFNGLVFEILYKKINDTIGMWQIDLTLPFYIRNLQFGAVSVTLPSMKVQIYTNGDFMIDLGFPANDDFSRSFSIQALPFVGSGGVYFGKLSSATSDRVPQTKKGSFSPVIAFGLGLRIGLGKDLDYGVLKAGMSLTIQGVLEGIFAWYNPYPTSLSAGSTGETQLVPAGSRQLVGKQSGALTAAANDQDVYYMIQARVSLVGKIYGSVDLGIITADLDIEVRVSIRLTLEKYRAIDIFFEARISLSLRVRINLGLFKITIRLSFKMELSFSFKIGKDGTPPWAQSSVLRESPFMKQLDADDDEECAVIPKMKWQPLLNSNPVKVPLLFTPQFTAGTDGPLGVGSPRKPYIVAMTYVQSTPAKVGQPPAPFDEIARGAFLWTLNAYLNEEKQDTTLEELLTQDITIKQLNEIYCYLTQPNLLEPFTEDEVLKFLENFFIFNVTIPQVIPPAAQVIVEEQEVSIFPIMPRLILTTSTGVEVNFRTQTPASRDYLAEVKKYFEEMAVRYKTAAEKANQATPKVSAELGEKSLASFIFMDFFAMLARSTVQDAISLLQTMETPLEPGESLADFVQRRSELGVDVQSLAMANVMRPLRAGVELSVPGAVYTVKRDDTVQGIAAKVNHDVVLLRSANPMLKGRLPEPATQLRLPEVHFKTSSTNPESLLDVSRFYGVSIASLAEANAHVPELFPAGESLLAPFSQQENIAKLVSLLQANGSFNNLSGLAARVLLQGLRPPSPKDGPYAGVPKPLYQLTGQQLDGTDLVADTTITLSVPEEMSEWFQLGPDADSLTYTVTTETAGMLTALKNAPFGPSVTFEQAKLLRIEPRRFTLPTSTLWQTPTLIAPMNQGNERIPETIEPHLWQFPSELMEIITGPQALQPKVELFTQRQEAPGQTYPPEPVKTYTWATTIEIQVRQTASGDKVFLPNTYEMTGMDGGASNLLENLLVWYADGKAPAIEKIRILYPPNGAVENQEVPPTGLRSDADPTFFLLQNNLSTASQPPQLATSIAMKLAAASPQRDPLGQKDIEFLKLLWESSIVNSGGYVLYYEAAKKGLPDYLFSQDGIARLTILVTYVITDNVLKNFLNNVVIHQAIDIENEVLYASPVPQTVSNFKLSPDQTLADVAARYRVTVSQLATQYDNARAKLAAGKHLRIPPLTYRAQPDEKLETIANRANVALGAVTELKLKRKAKDIADVRFVRLPETIWRVEDGDTLESLAQRFSTTVVTLAHANKNVPGLVVGTLQFDDRLEEAIATIPPGNVAFQFTRPAAKSDSVIIDAKDQLEQLYNLLGYRIKEANGFDATNSALPISPATPEGTDAWIYDSVVPVFPFLAPPADKKDPYNGVGNTVLVNFNWQDLFGNWIDSDLSTSYWPNKGFDVTYIDNLIALDSWPSVTSDYVIARSESGAGSNELTVTLRFNATLYEGDDPDALKEMALTDLGKFQIIYYQLLQSDVTVTLSSTMQGVLASSEEDSPKEVMIQFVQSIINFLTPISLGQPAPPAPADAGIAQPVADGNSQNIFALVVKMQIERNPDLVNDEFKDVPAVTVVSSRVPANAGKDAGPVLKAEAKPPLSLQEFALQLETAFTNLKVLVAAPKKGLGQVSEEIWIARLAPTATGIAFKIDGKNPSFFSVTPLARNLLSRPDVLVYPYRSGKFIGAEIPIETSQNSIDLDQMGRDFLSAMEEVLGPQFSSATWKLEYGTETPPPVEDPPNPQTHPYEALIDAKESLAQAISDDVVNVFEVVEVGSGLADARELMRQQLLINLTAAYTVDVVLQYPVEITHSQYPPEDLFAPQLFGKPVAQNPDDPSEVAKKDAFSFSTGKFSLAKRALGTHLTFTFETNREQQGRDGQQIDDLFTIDLFYQINAIEHEIHPVEGIEGYLASSWLSFVLPDSFDMPGARKILVDLGKQAIPVPLRAYPTPPSLSEQTFVPHVKQFVGDPKLLKALDDDDLLKARLWNYRCQYEYVGAAHDKILANIQLNAPPTGLMKARFADDDNPDLFAALVQFSAAYPAIANDLDKYLATGTNDEIARNAIASFAWLAQRAARAWFNWEQDRLLHSAPPVESPEYHFVIEQQPGKGGIVNDALLVTVTADSATRLPQLPVVEIAGYETKTWTQTMDSASYYFVSEATGLVLPYQTGRNLSMRQLVFKDFDILKVENGWAGLAVKRNENLLPDKDTNPDFVFQSPVVRFVNVLTPLLDPDYEINIAKYTQPKPNTLAQYLSNFLIKFFEAAQTVGNENRTIRLGASYAYGLSDSGASNTLPALLPDLEVMIPILLTTPTSISILPSQLGPESPLVKSVAETINSWISNNDPSGVDDTGKLWFDLSVYSSLSESQLPVLRMRKLFLETKLLV